MILKLIATLSEASARALDRSGVELSEAYSVQFLHIGYMLLDHQLELIRKLADCYATATRTCGQRHDGSWYARNPSKVRRLQALRDQTAAVIRQHCLAISAAA